MDPSRGDCTALMPFLKEHFPIISNIFIIMSCFIRKPDFCLCEKGADQLCSDCTADQLLHFDSTILPLFKSKISIFYPSRVAAQAGLCQSWWKSQKTGFHALRVISWMPDLCTRHLSRLVGKPTM